MNADSQHVKHLIEDSSPKFKKGQKVAVGFLEGKIVEVKKDFAGKPVYDVKFGDKIETEIREVLIRPAMR